MEVHPTGGIPQPWAATSGQKGTLIWKSGGKRSEERMRQGSTLGTISAVGALRAGAASRTMGRTMGRTVGRLVGRTMGRWDDQGNDGIMDQYNNSKYFSPSFSLTSLSFFLPLSHRGLSRLLRSRLGNTSVSRCASLPQVMRAH